ncbi:hydrolase [Microbacterium sp. MAHUQ-60]|uniref:hydrolase n=1 Tax=unclassified Microbacterium TaxID=2609290 RepID=UPI003614BC61
MIDIRRVDGGIVTGRFTDHHVHLQLVDHALLSGSRLGRVIDLGGNPTVLRRLAGHNSGDPRPVPELSPVSAANPGISPELRTPIIEYAGPFLTAPGGYPSDREWAPAGSVREVPDAASAAAAVGEAADAGAALIKIALNSQAGPVLADDDVRAIVSAAAAQGLPVVAHAEGPGQAQRAVRLGATRLAHAPFSERLGDDEIAEQAASAEWISTLAIHEAGPHAIAVDNVRRFAAAGGTILYGTDMGNGETPVDLNAAEIDALREADVDGVRLLEALAPRTDDPRALFLPGGDPVLARPLTPVDLEV